MHENAQDHHLVYSLYIHTLVENDQDYDNLLLCLRKGQKNKVRKNSGILR
jgi:hypothetical protein